MGRKKLANAPSRKPEYQTKYNLDHIHNKLITREKTFFKYFTNRNIESSILRDFLGITPLEFRLYLQFQFKDGMTLENHGSLWCFDHIQPLKSCLDNKVLNYNKFKELCHYTNIRPILSYDNSVKSSKFNIEDQVYKEVNNLLYGVVLDLSGGHLKPEAKKIRQSYTPEYQTKYRATHKEDSKKYRDDNIQNKLFAIEKSFFKYRNVDGISNDELRKFLGISIPKFITYIQSKLSSDMNFSNYGTVWSFKHIKPLKSCLDNKILNYNKFKELCHYTNITIKKH